MVDRKGRPSCGRRPSLARATLVLVLLAFAGGLAPADELHFYPFPTYRGNRDEGDTFGAVGVFLITNPENEITHVIAPLAQYNVHNGFTGGLVAFGYPSDHQEYKAVLSYSSIVDREIRLKYSDKKIFDEKYAVEAQVKYFQDGFERFYGFGPDSRERDESNHKVEELSYGFGFGKNLTPHLTVGVGERYRDVDIGRGTVDTLPFTGDVFPDARGVDGVTLLGHRLYASYDTRDNGQTPTEGLLLSGQFELVTGIAGDTPTVFEKWNVEGRKFLPHGEDRQFVFVGRARLDFTSGPDAPFFEQASLGGSNSLRAFGGDRFIDRHAWLLNFEERIRIYRTKILGYKIELEVAPHLDVGQVFSGEDVFSKIQVNPGATARLLSRPNVVGGITVSYGREGVNVFGGFSFPF
ncbi:MAG: BamA/TamA family outer membrane protein [Planctomycetes bacterium]|nr:BamA/TamA family outer membrane protein [Planctomycetota bacterium]